MKAAGSNGVDGLSAYYWRSYLEWRAEYGVGDECMVELVAAVRSELQSPALSGDEVMRLRRLADLIEAEMTVMQALALRGVA